MRLLCTDEDLKAITPLVRNAWVFHESMVELHEKIIVAGDNPNSYTFAGEHMERVARAIHKNLMKSNSPYAKEYQAKICANTEEQKQPNRFCRALNTHFIRGGIVGK